MLISASGALKGPTDCQVAFSEIMKGYDADTGGTAKPCSSQGQVLSKATSEL